MKEQAEDKATSDETLQRIIRAISSHVNGSSIYIYGSRARGRQTAASDYDFLVFAQPLSIVTSLGRLRSLRRALKSSATPIDLMILSPFSAKAASRNLSLLSRTTDAKLVFGTRDYLRASKLGSPSPESVLFNTLFRAKWFLRYLVQRDGKVTLLREGVKKMIRLFELDSTLGGPRPVGLDALQRVLESEASKEVPDPGLVCRALADFIDGIMTNSLLSLRKSTPSYLAWYLSLLFARGARGGRSFPLRRDSRLLLARAMVYLYRSMETDPPSFASLRQAEALIEHSVSGVDILRGTMDTPQLLSSVKSAIRTNWNSIMGYPFGFLTLHRPFVVVLT